MRAQPAHMRRALHTLLLLLCCACGEERAAAPASAVLLRRPVDPALRTGPAQVWKREAGLVVSETREARPLVPDADGRTWRGDAGRDALHGETLRLHIGVEAEAKCVLRVRVFVDGEAVHEAGVVHEPASSPWEEVRTPRLPASGAVAVEVLVKEGAPRALHVSRVERLAPGKRARGMLLVSIDTLRADRVGAVGGTRGLTPRIDAWAQGAVVCERALSSAPWTVPSYASLFTARTPLAHGAGLVPDRQAAWPDGGADDATHTRLDPSASTLAGRLRDAGWATAGFHASVLLDPGNGLSRGFDLWLRHGTRADEGVRQALAWIKEQRGRDWFAFVHLIDPHIPYAPPDAWARRHAGVGLDEIDPALFDVERLRASPPDAPTRQLLERLYDAEVAWTDSQVGALFDGLAAEGLLADTIVALHSDHGEEFWEHGGFEHGHALVEETLRVPLAVSAPGLAPRRVHERVRAIDLAPTLLELAGVGPLPGAEGRSFAKSDGAPRDVQAEALLYGREEAKAWYTGDARILWKAAQAPQLERDPGGEPLADEALRARLRDAQRRRAAELGGRLGADRARYSEEQTGELRALGYTGIETPR